MNTAQRLRKSELACHALILFGPAVSGALLLATAGYCVWVARAGLAVQSSDVVFYVVPPLSTIASFVLFRRALARGRADAPLHAALFAAIALTLWESMIWFGSPMHDIAMAFGSHGRFGDQTLNEDGSPFYFLRDETLPWLLFGPALLGVVGHWLLQRRRGPDRTTSSV